jgi:aldose 1-epimerase
MTSKITCKNWGYHEGKAVLLFRIENLNGAYIELTNYGACIVAGVVPDHNNQLGHVILGLDSLGGYLVDQCYLGSTIGRFANRIGKAAFELGGKQYFLDANDNGNSNHSGHDGYNSKVFDYQIYDDKIRFTLQSADGEGGYPGNVELTVTYQWTDSNQLKINYDAMSDQLTIANFTNHAYFNLSGQESSISDHQLTIYASRVLQTDENYIPTGKILPAGTKSFSSERIGDQIKQNDNEQGFNDYYILNERKDNNNTVSLAAVLDQEGSGRRLNVYTSYPGLMFYTGDFLNSPSPGHLNKLYKPFDGLCLECQSYPDAPNHSSFPSATFKPGELYPEKIIYEFTLIPILLFCLHFIPLCIMGYFSQAQVFH